MKKIIITCILSILTLPIFANTENDLPVEKIDSISFKNETTNTEKTKEMVILPKEKKEKTNKYLRVKGYFGLPGEVGGYKYGVDEMTKLADLDIGVEGMIEGVYRISEKSEIAMGLGFQGIGNINSSGVVTGNNYAMPIYFSGKYNLFKSPVYLKGVIGVTYNYGTDDLKTFIAEQEDTSLALTKDNIELENGLYGALGVGLEFWRMEIEGLYSINTINSKYVKDSKTYTRELENHRITVGASYAFDWNK